MNDLKRLLTLCLAIVLILGGVPQGVFREVLPSLMVHSSAVNATEKALSIDGTSVSWTDFANSSTYQNKTVTLEEDLVLGGNIPILNYIFKGTFDGNGHTITIQNGAVFNESTDGSAKAHNGLFPKTEGAVLKNIVIQLDGKLTNYNAENWANDGKTGIGNRTSDRLRASGILLGYGINTTVENCAVLSKASTAVYEVYFRGNVAAAVWNDPDYAGALIGYLASGVVQKCYSEVSIKACRRDQYGALAVGGLVGRSVGSIQDSKVYKADVTAYHSWPQHIASETLSAGGIAGELGGSLLRCLSQDTRQGVYDIAEDTLKTGISFDYASTASGSYGAIAGVAANTLTTDKIYASTPKSLSNSGSLVNVTGTTIDSSLKAYAFGNDLWADTVAGVPNLAWLVNKSPENVNVTVAGDDATLVITPSNNDWNISGTVPLQGTMATPSAVNTYKEAPTNTANVTAIKDLDTAADKVYYSGTFHAFSATVSGVGVTTTKPKVTWSVKDNNGGTFNGNVLTINDSYTGDITIVASIGTSTFQKVISNITIGKATVIDATGTELAAASQVPGGTQKAFGLKLTGSQKFASSAITWQAAGTLTGTTSITKEGVLTIDANQSVGSKISLTATVGTTGITVSHVVSVTEKSKANEYTVGMTPDSNWTATSSISGLAGDKITVNTADSVNLSGITYKLAGTPSLSVSAPLKGNVSGNVFTIGAGAADGNLAVAGSYKWIPAETVITTTIPIVVASDGEGEKSVTLGSSTGSLGEQKLAPSGKLTITAPGSIEVDGVAYTKSGEISATVSENVGVFSGTTFTAAAADASGEIKLQVTYKAAEQTKTFNGTVEVAISKAVVTPASNIKVVIPYPTTLTPAEAYSDDSTVTPKYYIKVVGTEGAEFLYSYGDKLTPTDIYSVTASDKGLALTAEQISVAKSTSGLTFRVRTRANIEKTHGASDILTYIIVIDENGNITNTLKEGAITSAVAPTVAKVTGQWTSVTTSMSIRNDIIAKMPEWNQKQIPGIAQGSIKLTIGDSKGSPYSSKYPDHLRQETEDSTSVGTQTPTPVIRPRGDQVINPQLGITIEIPQGAVVYYTITPDGTDKTVVDPKPGDSTHTRTHLYAKGQAIPFPDNSATFTVKAIATMPGKVNSEIDTITYTKGNLPSPALPTLLIGEERALFDPTIYYSEGTEFHFSHDKIPESGAEGSIIRYTVNMGSPTSSFGSIYNKDTPPKLMAASGTSRVEIRAIYYNSLTQLTSQIAMYTVNLKQTLGAPIASLENGSLIRPSEKLQLTLNDDILALYSLTRVTYKDGLDQEDGAQLPYSPGSEEPIIGNSYISINLLEGESYSLPKIMYLLNNESGNVALDGIDYKIGLRVVTYDDVGPKSVKYQNPGDITLTGATGDSIKLRVATVSTTDDYSSGETATFTYTVRGGVLAPTSFPVSEPTKPAVLKVGGKIALSTDTPDSIIFYTMDGSKPSVKYEEILDESGAKTGSYHWVPQGETKQYSDTQPVVVENDKQLLLTVNAMAVSKSYELENSNIVTFRYEVEPLENAATVVSNPPTNSTEYTGLKNKELIRLSTTTLNSTIYYTVDGTLPEIDARIQWNQNAANTQEYRTGSDEKGRYYYPIADENAKVYEPETYIYNAQARVPMAPAQDETVFTIIAVARENSNPSVYADSIAASFTYRLKEAERPTAIPFTSNESVTTISPLSVINLSTVTSNADIFYTTDNTRPNYQDYLLNGDSSATRRYDPSVGIVMPKTVTTFFTIRAIARTTDGSYAESAEAQFTYQPPAPVQAVFASPSAGAVVKDQQITLKCSTETAKIFYRIYNTAPDISNEQMIPKPYEDQIYDTSVPIIVNKAIWIVAIAEHQGVISVPTVYAYTIAPELPEPYSSLKTGSVVHKGTRIRLNGAGTIAYTIDGSDPRQPSIKAKDDEEASTVFYGDSIVVDADYGKSMTIRAYVYKAGYTPSNVVSFTYTVADEKDYLNAVPASGTVVKSGTEITLTTGISDAIIFSTTGNTAPNLVNRWDDGDWDEDDDDTYDPTHYIWKSGKSTRSGSTVVVSGEPGSVVTVRAVAKANGSDGGSVKVFTYTLMDKTPAPTASIPSGAVVFNGATITLSGKEGDIFYTTDGTEPSTSSRLYVDPIPVNGSMVLKAISVADKKLPSDSVTYVYSFAEQVFAPTMDPPSGAIDQGSQITLSTYTEGATIYYTTNGVDPTTESTIYSGPITVMRPVTIKAIAVKNGMHNSPSNTGIFTVIEPPSAEENDEGNGGQNQINYDRLVSRRTFSEQDVGPKYSDVVLNDTQNNTILSAEEETVPKNAKLVVKQVESSNIDKNAVDSTGYAIVSQFELSLEQNGERIEPYGEMDIGLPIPSGYQNGVVAICRIGENSAEVLETRRSGNKAYVSVHSLGDRYAITVPASVAASSDALSVVDSAVWILGGCSIVGFATFGIWWTLRKKRLASAVSEEKPVDDDEFVL